MIGFWVIFHGLACVVAIHFVGKYAFRQGFRKGEAARKAEEN